MSNELKAIHDSLKAKDLARVKELCRQEFGCNDKPLNDLAETLTEQGFFMVCEALTFAQRNEQTRTVIALFLAFVIDLDGPDEAATRQANAAAQLILKGLKPAA